MLLLTKSTQAQVVRDSIVTDSVVAVDSFSLEDSSVYDDSTAKDTAAIQSLEQRLGIRISKDALPAAVTATAADSAVLHMAKNTFYLYGKAQVNYEDMQLNAGKITYFQNDNMVTAVPEFDTAGLLVGRPEFKQGQEKFTYDTLQYNFKSKRAIVRNARSQYGEGYVFSEQVKRNPDQSLYGLHNIYTTCALDTPHFGINAKKIKVIPNRVIASGPANIVIEQVPTPLFLPFGLFPITQGHKSGFRLPTYTIEAGRGIGLLNTGYYFYLNDHVDLLLQGNIYSKGSWLLSGVSTYSNRYRYQGALNFSYAYEKIGEEFESDARRSRDFIINWRHQSDQKSRPGVSFNASVDVGTGSFYQNNTYDVNQITRNQLSSSIAYSKAWQNRPFSLSLASRHSQNVGTGQVDVTLPEVAFFVSQFNPFQGKNATGNKWYDKITAQYTFSAVNKVSFTDSLFNLDSLVRNNGFQHGAIHTVPISAAYNVLRFFQLNFNTTYREYWLAQQSYRFYNQNEEREDTISNTGFFTARDFNFGTGLSTRIYGLKMFRKGKVAGIRHVITPNVGFVYTPDFARAPFRYGYRTILNPAGAPVYISPYETSVMGAPGYNNFGDYSSNLTYGLNNNVQIKVRTNDSVGTKNVTLIDGLSVNGAYNLAADSFKWSDVSVNFRTNIMDIISVSASANFSPYVFDTSRGSRIDRTMLDAGKGLARFTNGNIGVDASFRSITEEAKKKRERAPNADEFNRLMQLGRYDDYADFDVPWNVSLRYLMNVNRRFNTNSRRDTTEYDSNISITGDVNLTSRWKFLLTTGYNFTSKDLNLTQITLIRDLHCWEMRLQAVPFGNRKFYFFTLNVKAQVLQDLKLVRRRDFRDSNVF
ncbi:MAG: LPS-assembly protein LptD [Sphingobacteriales bacterium]|nr:MAG: LPS-assembly protein LptD [Sphingobacteriales bacterium]